MSLLEWTIGWLAPTECMICKAEGQVLCGDCAVKQAVPFGEHCWNCGALSPCSKTCERCRRKGFPAHVWITADYAGTAADLIQKYKFGYVRAAAQPLAGLMAKTFMQYAPPGAGKNCLIVPVPTATKRIRQRSFDHTGLLARLIARRLDLALCTGLMRRGQSRQVGAKRNVRMEQLKDSFYIRRPGEIEGKKIILVDDVATTGSTLIACASELRKNGARSVDALVFAKRL